MVISAPIGISRADLLVASESLETALISLRCALESSMYHSLASELLGTRFREWVYQMHLSDISKYYII